MLTGDMTNVLDIHMANGCKCKMKESKIIGFCHCRLHKGYLNASILKEHECLRKNCFYLEKYEDRPFWVQREKAKEKKLKSKEQMKALQNRLLGIEEELEKLVEAAQGIADRMGYPIVITRVSRKADSSNDYEYIINYVSDDRYNDWHEYFDLVLFLGKCHGGRYTLRHLRHPNGEYASIDDWYSRKR